MNPEDLQPASWRSVEFLASAATLSGGRRGAVKRFPNSDRQLVEDLGKVPREFVLSGVVSARRDSQGGVIQSYEQARDSLLEALEKKGTGVLLHPFYGRLESLVVRTYSLSENTTRLGDSPIEITFAVSDTTGLPRAQKSVVGEVSAANDLVVKAAKASVAENFGVTSSFTGNFQHAMNKVSSVVSAVDAAVKPAAVLASELDPFKYELGELSGSVASLVKAPVSLADSIAGLFSTVSGLYATATATFDAFARLFDFGDEDEEILPTTAGRVERRANRDAVNSAVQALALGYAYRSGAFRSFETTDEIDAVSGTLEDQYQKLASSGILDSSVGEKLSLERISTIRYFEEQRITRPQVIVVRTELTSARLMAFRYYGSSELGDTIAKLNGLLDSSTMSGLVEILST